MNSLGRRRRSWRRSVQAWLIRFNSFDYISKNDFSLPQNEAQPPFIQTNFFKNVMKVNTECFIWKSSELNGCSPLSGIYLPHIHILKLEYTRYAEKNWTSSQTNYLATMFRFSLLALYLLLGLAILGLVLNFLIYHS